MRGNLNEYEDGFTSIQKLSKTVQILRLQFKFFLELLVLIITASWSYFYLNCKDQIKCYSISYLLIL